jgi:DNA modification methylase
MGFDVGLTGFAAGEVEELFGKAAAKAGLTDPDATPEVPAEPVSRLGDVWLLGRHRIACGDCTDAAVVERLLAGAQPHLMVTDPPYGVNYDTSWRDGMDLNLGKKLGFAASTCTQWRGWTLSMTMVIGSASRRSAGRSAKVAIN